MSILDIGIPKGFIVENKDLEKLSTGKERYIQKYEKNKVLSERGSLIFHLDKVLCAEKQRISFRMHKMLDVGLLQPAAVTIYEYYSPDARCIKFYHPERAGGAIYTLCKGDLCLCAEELCHLRHEGGASAERRCGSLFLCVHQHTLYFYKVSVVGMDLGQDSDIYHLKVDQVVKEGTDDDDVEGRVRQFLALPHCREHLGLEQGKSYLIMGKFKDVPRLGESLQYIFGEHTWVEYWPTEEESQTQEYWDRYNGISGLQNILLRTGCDT
ncbi:hypothetical protein PO909_015942 [Leuciscus waleckii]